MPRSSTRQWNCACHSCAGSAQLCRVPGVRLAAPLGSEDRGPSTSPGERVIVSIVLAVVIATLLSACWLWALTKLFGLIVPIVNLLIIAVLCSALAPLPRVGWVLATMIMVLLLVRTTEADGWREVVLMVVGSNVIWFLVASVLLGLV